MSTHGHLFNQTETSSAIKNCGVTDVLLQPTKLIEIATINFIFWGEAKLN